jgi:hypothetical protein
MADYHYFPTEFLDMQQELGKHPDLMQEMTKCDSVYLEDRMAHLCTALGIVVDDTFDCDELAELAELITKTMYEKRTGLCITH